MTWRVRFMEQRLVDKWLVREIVLRPRTANRPPRAGRRRMTDRSRQRVALAHEPPAADGRAVARPVLFAAGQLRPVAAASRSNWTTRPTSAAPSTPASAG